MAVFKCKMCGGALEIPEGSTVTRCVYCGTHQTLPRLEDDRRANLYDRANHFRRNNDFDKAAAIYEKILTEDGQDAEAYWSLVLCRFGIEYVEDPATKQRIPTVNRAQYTSVFDDDNYKSALEYATEEQRAIYEAEAHTISEIQKGIISISSQEEPFDIFICYKETDEAGRRTRDSVLAQELYYQLKGEGYKVFFSRITLEDKIGSAYEPYIFAALNSSKIMVVVGTKPEFFNAVWVKNEWSRYLTLIKNGAKKTLIPAYRDMDPYDLPEEFSHLQAQDMSKLGFMQDLVRGIKKIMSSYAQKTEAPKETVIKETVIKERAVETVAVGGGVSTAPLLRRTFMFLEDGEWERADDFCEQVLNQDPENAEAYLAKLMIDLNVRTREELKNCAEPFDRNHNYQRVLRFADETLKATLTGYDAHIKARNENARLEKLYGEALTAMNQAATMEDYTHASELFDAIRTHRDSSEFARRCLENAEIARKDAILSDANAEMSQNTLAAYERAIKLLTAIPGWRDSDALIEKCRVTIDALKAKAEADRIRREKEAEEERIEREKRAKRNKKIAMIATPVVCLLLVFVILLPTVIIPTNNYNQAIALMEAGKYEEALSAFEKLDGYKDSDNKITACNTAILDGKYNEAIALMEAGNVVEAYEAFIALNGYKDSADKANSIYDKYQLKTANVGEYVFFGAYEQDNNASNGKEDIEWLVLDAKDSKMLVVSKYALDCKQYHTSYEDVTWEGCTLRGWLNNDFLNAAFSAEEKAMIPTVTVSADENPEYDVDPGNATQDKVFLLSITEANTYFSADSQRQCMPTDYAVANGAWRSSGNCWWWLRTPGHLQTYGAYVDFNGGIDESGTSVRYGNYAVRPAMWIDLGA